MSFIQATHLQILRRKSSKKKLPDSDLGSFIGFVHSAVPENKQI